VLEELTRFNEVKRQLGGVTQLVLRQTLRYEWTLEHSGEIELMQREYDLGLSASRDWQLLRHDAGTATHVCSMLVRTWVGAPET